MSHLLPAAFLASLQNVKGFDEDAFVRVHDSGGQITSVRLNPAKQSLLTGSYPAGMKIPWSTHGYYLSGRPSFTADPLFHAGAYYVQEASSMFLETAIRQCCDPGQPLKVLDLCAAPCGKSTLIQSLISDGSFLVSNEVIKTRVGVLAENLTKWGALNVVVTCNDPKDFQRLPAYFDLVVVDAPCSGSGLFRKDPGAIAEWSLNNVEHCSLRQERILEDILPALKPGGFLIYSTCSYAEKEDEGIADRVLDNPQMSGFRLELDESWGIVETVSPLHNAYGYRFYPDKLKGEGFFIASFKKNNLPGDMESPRSKQNRLQSKFQGLTRQEIAIISPYVKDTGRLAFIKWQEEILALPTALSAEMDLLQSAFYIKKMAVRIGTIIRDELLPDHELAMSTLIADTVPAIEVDERTALQYLRRQDISLDTKLKGWALIKYENTVLGWVKVLPNRINNYYPKSWRILNK